MKNISINLKNHIAGEVTSLATCWKLSRRDGHVFGFTDHDRDLVVSGVDYIAGSGFTPSAVQSSGGFAVDNLELEGMLDAATITEADILAGVYDYAEIEIFMVNYADLSQGKLMLRRGWIGEVSLGKNYFVAEVRGLAQRLSQRIGDVYSPLCRSGLEGCGVNLLPFTVAGELTHVTDAQVFADATLAQATGYFNHGKITFLSGANEGLSMEVKDFRAGGNITLVLPMPNAVTVGDNFSMYAGCDKSFELCVNKFNNAVNFRGEPHVPGLDRVLETSSTRS